MGAPDELTGWVDAHPAGRVRTGPLDRVRERTWGTVWRVPTAHGPVWHPFVSLLTPLETLPETSAQAVRTAYLSGFGDPATHEHAHAPYAHLLRLAHSWDLERSP